MTSTSFAAVFSSAGISSLIFGHWTSCSGFTFSRTRAASLRGSAVTVPGFGIFKPLLEAALFLFFGVVFAVADFFDPFIGSSLVVKLLALVVVGAADEGFTLSVLRWMGYREFLFFDCSDAVKGGSYFDKSRI